MCTFSPGVIAHLLPDPPTPYAQREHLLFRIHLTFSFSLFMSKTIHVKTMDIRPGNLLGIVLKLVLFLDSVNKPNECLLHTSPVRDTGDTGTR